jgi:hypothetical protein
MSFVFFCTNVKWMNLLNTKILNVKILIYKNCAVVASAEKKSGDTKLNSGVKWESPSAQQKSRLKDTLAKGHVSSSHFLFLFILKKYWNVSCGKVGPRRLACGLRGCQGPEFRPRPPEVGPCASFFRTGCHEDAVKVRLRSYITITANHIYHAATYLSPIQPFTRKVMEICWNKISGLENSELTNW